MTRRSSTLAAIAGLALASAAVLATAGSVGAGESAAGQWSRNLIVNPGAEQYSGGPFDGYKVLPLRGWTAPRNSKFTAQPYAREHFYNNQATFPPKRGKVYFAGQPRLLAGRTPASLSQTIDLRPLAQKIAAGAQFEASAWLASYTFATVRMTMQVTWLNGQGRPTGKGTTLTGPTGVDSAGAGVPTKFELTRSNGTVPKAARQARVTLRVVGGGTGYDPTRAFADNLLLRVR